MAAALRTLDRAESPPAAILGGFAHFAPPQRLNAADWVEANVCLPSDVSALVGPMGLYAYQRGLLEAVSDPEISHISFIKPVRIGATALMAATIAHFVKNDPCPILAIQPTQDDARDWVISTIDPTFEASPSLRGALMGNVASRATITSRRFPGGWFKCVWPVARNLRRHTVRVLLLDELDGYEQTPEGPPYDLAVKRTLTYPNRLIFAASTPTDSETSKIHALYEESDKRVFEIPCPHCGEHFEPRWQHVKWDKSPEGEHLPDTAHMVCPANGCVFEEKHKIAAVEAGRWRATAPHVKGHAGFRCSALISPLENARWPQIVREFLKAKGDPELMRVWTNTLMGEPFENRAGEGLDENALAARAEPFGLDAIPEDVRVICAGVDVQAYGLEIVTLGFSATQTFALGYETIHGPPTGDQVWLDLDALLKRRFAHPLGGTIGYDAAAVDSGDGNVTDIVYSFTRPRFGRRVVSIKGHDGNRPLIEKSSKHGLYVVGVDGGKSRLFGLLDKPGHVRFSADLPSRFYEELCSERRVTFYKFGQPKKRWERIKGMRAEALDSTVYAMAVRQLVAVDVQRRENELREIVKPKPAPTVYRSKWMQRGRP